MRGPESGTGSNGSLSDREAFVLALARSWIGTPYRHQGVTKGVGCDCLGLIRGVYGAATGREPALPPPYGGDWAERAGEERLLRAAEAHCGQGFAVAHARPGDILVFRFRPDAAAKHLGLLSERGRFIHAYEAAGVVESALVPSWQRRIAACFRIPG